MQSTSETSEAPSLLRWGLTLAASAGLTGMLCCVAPMVLFMFGLMGGAYAISFADFFYQADGSPGTGAYLLRVLAVVVGAGGVWQYRSRQQACSIDPRRQQKNLLLLVVLVTTLGAGFFFSFEELSSWYFDAYIVPAQQAELHQG
ncbi:MAG TPA: hypothetical protein DFR83_04535 [Deltaproteobacteria bacterium]|nr:hypothetical protein [Deltaproteobacteria bacterium]